MIVRIRGRLDTVRGDLAYVESEGITYGVLICASTAERLVKSGMVGREVVFHTLQYIEGGIGMGNLIPRLVGFLSEGDLEFFTLLITVQGLGVRKTLRALVLPVRDIARAIELNDLMTLRKLPEIGAKTAQKIVMELKGKALPYAGLSGDEEPFAPQGEALAEEYQVEALAVLTQLQYPEAEARDIVVRTARARPDIQTSQELIQEVFRRLGPAM